MKYLDMKYSKTLFFSFLPMVIGSSKAWADLPLPMGNNFSSCFDAMAEAEIITSDFLLTSDSILFVGFLLWIAYILFFFPKNTLKQL